MKTQLLFKIGAGTLFSGLVVVMIITELDIFNKNQYKDIYIYASNDKAITDKSETKDFLCRLKSENQQSFDCSIKKINATIQNNQITKTKITDNVSQGNIDITKDFSKANEFFRIFVDGGMTGFKNVDQKIELIDKNDKQKENVLTELTILFSTDIQRKTTIAKSNHFLGTEAMFDNEKNSLKMSGSYKCLFDKESEYQKCKIYDFSTKNEAKKYDQLIYTKHSSCTQESLHIESNKNYIIKLYNDSELTGGKITIKNEKGETASLKAVNGIYKNNNLIILE